jgi:hypothetical protein
VESFQQYLSELYNYIKIIVSTVMDQWYLGVLVGVGIIVIARYLESILITALTVVVGIFVVLPVILQAFQSGNTILGIISIVILALLYFIMKYIYKVALFAVGLVSGYVFTNAVLGFVEIPSNVPTEIHTGFGILNWVSLAVGIFVGFVTVRFTRQLTALIGIFAGSYLASMGIITAYTGDPNSWKKAFPNPYGLLETSQSTLIVFLSSLLILTVIGIYFNFARKKKGS